MLLRHYQTREELQELLDSEITGEKRDRVENNVLENALRIELSCEFPSSLEVYGYPEVESQYFFLFEYNDLQYPNMHIRKTLSGHNFELLEESAPLIVEKTRNLISKHGKILVISDEATCEVFNRHLTGLIGGKYANPINPCGMFYMTAAQREALLENSDAPEGFTIEPVDVDKDGETIHLLWQYSICAEVTKNRLRYLPSFCARTKEGDIAGWVMTDRFGQISNLYTKPEHRNRGVGKALEMRIAKEFVRRGMRVYKNVETGNTSVFNGSLRSPFWTLWTIEDEDNNETKRPNLQYFRRFERD